MPEQRDATGRSGRWGPWLRRALAAWIAWRLLAPESVPDFDEDQQVPLELPGHTVFVRGVELFVREAGPPDAATIVLVHGWGDDSMAIYPRLIPLLAADHHVVAVDNRNHGKSDSVRGRYEITTMADELDAVLDQLGIIEATVFGYSMGGMVAQHLARRHPDRVARLGLSGTAAAIPPLADTGVLAEVGLALVRAAERVSRSEVSWLRTQYLRRVGAVADEHARWYYTAHQNRDPDLYWGSGDAISGFDSRSWVGDLGVPTMVVVTTRDQLMAPRWQWDLVDRLQDPAVVEVAGRHEAPLTHPEVFAEAIASFARGDRPSTRRGDDRAAARRDRSRHASA